MATINDHDKMVEALKQFVVPELRTSGFKGSFPHFRRRVGDKVDLITFQFDKYGGGFVIEIAKCSSAGVSRGGKHIPFEKVTAHDIDRDRPRIGGKAIDDGEDHWFRFDEISWTSNIFHKVARQALTALETQAEGWWKAQS